MSDAKDRLAEALSDRYTLGDVVGVGGMATVYRAEDIKHGRTVALKVLKPELSSAMGTDRFPREIRLIASFNHPHILSLYDSGESDGFLYRDRDLLLPPKRTGRFGGRHRASPPRDLGAARGRGGARGWRPTRRRAERRLRRDTRARQRSPSQGPGLRVRGTRHSWSGCPSPARRRGPWPVG